MSKWKQSNLVEWCLSCAFSVIHNLAGIQPGRIKVGSEISVVPPYLVNFQLTQLRQSKHQISVKWNCISFMHYLMEVMVGYKARIYLTGWVSDCYRKVIPIQCSCKTNPYHLLSFAFNYFSFFFLWNYKCSTKIIMFYSKHQIEAAF